MPQTNSQLPGHRQTAESDPVFRIACTIGMLLTAFGAFLPKGHDWVVIGIVMVAFCYLYED
jgi:hypothetical protein